MESKFLHLIDLSDFPASTWNNLVLLGKDIKNNPEKYSSACKGKIMATLFYEPSTRTQMSFQTAMLRLGGSIIGFDNPATSSVSKGENLKDTTKIVSSYADVLVMRHPLEGAAKAAALTADCPIINAGDGGHLHPTQTLTDLLTLYESKGRLNNLRVGLCGDLKNGRTVHSLVKALSCYKGNEFVFISTPELSMPGYIKDELMANNCEFEEISSIEEAISSLDVLYMTRIQKERFNSEEEYNSQKDIYLLNRKKMLKAPADLAVLHPLPRVDEIAIEVDDDPRALYFKQAENGVYVRMALIISTIDSKSHVELLRGELLHGVKCTNPRCITNTEHYLPHSFKLTGDIAECEYCNERQLI